MLPIGYPGRESFHSKVVHREEPLVSIVRVGLSETKNFAEGYDAIFGKKKTAKPKKAKASVRKTKKTKKR
jgi:hypothetical protein